ncbi:MAG TPA: prolyl oligopeptidase family serine peptidase [Blastocatellia bacterium]|nr:prolyl oligopeptidase family serine peptidase [Blastocatellia bacterium]
MFRRLTILAALVVIGSGAYICFAQEHKAPPATRVDNVTETLHGVTITDPYRWLEDQNSPETRAWINAQNEYSASVLGSLPFRGRIRERLTQLLKIDTITAPVARGGRYFLYKRRADQNQAAIYVRNGVNGKDELLLDPNTMSADQTTSVQIQDISADGKLMVYGVRQGGEDEVTISLLDVDTRKELADRLPRGRIGVSLKPDKTGFYYSRFTNNVGGRVYYHAMGTDSARDIEVFGNGYGPEVFVGANLSPDGHYLFLVASRGSAGDKTELYFQDLRTSGPITTIVNDLDAGFSTDIAGDDHLYLLTNWNAPNRHILDVDLKKPQRANWREVVPEAQSVITGFSAVGGKIFVNYLENAVTRTRIFEASGKYARDIAYPTMGSTSGMVGDWDRDEGFYTFSSFAQPATIYRYQVASGKQEVFARLNVPVQSDQIEVKQVWYESKDKTKIPMFLVYKKGLKLDGNNPVFLTGYGGFNLNRTPGFSSVAAYWAESGGVYALPNLRGGGEFGEKWHKAGMFENKQNVFDDFIAAAEWLIRNKYTNPSKLAISGGSNGGLLVGAAMTQRPDLFQAVVCSYPLLDMIRYQSFMLARLWVPEYGSSENAEQFKYIYAYSPYHHVKKGEKYPAVLFVTGDADTRVAPLHARKMTALVQASTGSDRPVLLHYNTKAGHSGGLPVTQQIEDQTDELSFLFWQLGVMGKK